MKLEGFFALKVFRQDSLLVSPVRAAHDSDREPLIRDKSFQETERILHKIVLHLAFYHNPF
jgi:hypothetical protein